MAVVEEGREAESVPELTTEQLARIRAEESQLEIVGPFTVDGLSQLNEPRRQSSVLGFFVTGDCPLACAHCSSHAGGLFKGDMPVETMEAGVRQAKEAGLTHVNISGGEPFVNFEGVTRTLGMAKALGMETSVITSALWAKTPEEADRHVERLASIADTMFISIDKFHQRVVPLDQLRVAVASAQAKSMKVIILNCMLEEDLHRGMRMSDDARTLALEYGLTVHSWPMQGMGRATKLRKHFPSLSADQPCGTVALPSLYPNGDVHACCGGMGKFKEGHPLFKGNIHQTPLSDMVRDNSRSLFEQGIRVFGPIALLKMLGESHEGFRDQCSACGALCKAESSVERVEAALLERPDLLEAITAYRLGAGDPHPEDHMEKYWARQNPALRAARDLMRRVAQWAMPAGV